MRSHRARPRKNRHWRKRDTVGAPREHVHPAGALAVLRRAHREVRVAVAVHVARARQLLTKLAVHPAGSVEHLPLAALPQPSGAAKYTYARPPLVLESVGSDHQVAVPVGVQIPRAPERDPETAAPAVGSCTSVMAGVRVKGSAEPRYTNTLRPIRSSASNAPTATSVYPSPLTSPALATACPNSASTPSEPVQGHRRQPREPGTATAIDVHLRPVEWRTDHAPTTMSAKPSASTSPDPATAPPKYPCAPSGPTSVVAGDDASPDAAPR